MTSGTDQLYAVMMAGGQGTRLWPLSRKNTPKHVLHLVGGRSLFSDSVQRLRPLIPPDRTLVVTVAEHAPLLYREVPDLPESNFLLEPYGRGTAAVVGWAALEIRRRTAEGVMACLPADHLIKNPGELRSLLEAGLQAALDGHLVTLGIPVTAPDTGYGYLERGPEVGRFRGRACYRVASFREKPEEERAHAYMAAGSYLWNSGMFVWKASRILEEIERHMPRLHKALQSLESTLGLPSQATALADQWAAIEPETIDYGVMEKVGTAVVLPSEGLGWLDLGTWDRVLEAGPVDRFGNRTIGDRILAEETRGSLILQGADRAKRWLVTLGVEDLIVVDTGDVLLICARDRAEEVRRLVDRMGEVAGPEYL